MIRCCSLDGLSYDEREDVIRDLSLEPKKEVRFEGGLTVFEPKESKRKKKPEPQLALADSVAGYVVWQSLTPIQRLVAQGVLVEGKGYNEMAIMLSRRLGEKVHLDDIALAHRCACDVARSVAIAC